MSFLPLDFVPAQRDVSDAPVAFRARVTTWHILQGKPCNVNECAIAQLLKEVMPGQTWVSVDRFSATVHRDKEVLRLHHDGEHFVQAYDLCLPVQETDINFWEGTT